jgi:hypothetical protein
MKKTTTWLSYTLIGITTASYCLSIEPGVYAQTPERQSPQDVLKSDWDGTWDCNLDGRSAVVEFSYESTEDRVFGRISDNGGEWIDFGERKLDGSDLRSSRRDHMLPLLYNGKVKWMLMMHTWERNYASGYTYWEGIPFGLQCHKRS